MITIKEWFVANKLCLNLSKTKDIIFFLDLILVSYHVCFHRHYALSDK